MPKRHAFQTLNLLTVAVLLWAIALDNWTQRSEATWESWPSEYAIYLLQKTTAAEAREYLGILSETMDSEPTGSAAEILIQGDVVYLCLGDNIWVMLDVVTAQLIEQEGSLSVVEVEGGGYVVLE